MHCIFTAIYTFALSLTSWQPVHHDAIAKSHLQPLTSTMTCRHEAGLSLANGRSAANSYSVPAWTSTGRMNVISYTR